MSSRLKYLALICGMMIIPLAMSYAQEYQFRRALPDDFSVGPEAAANVAPTFDGLSPPLSATAGSEEIFSFSGDVLGAFSDEDGDTIEAVSASCDGAALCQSASLSGDNINFTGSSAGDGSFLMTVSDGTDETSALIPVTLAAAVVTGSVIEWGARSYTHSGDYVAVDACHLTTCAIDNNGNLECWNGSVSNPAYLCISHQSSASECFTNPGGSVNDYGPFVALDYKYSNGCAINTNNEVVCWTGSESNIISQFPSDLGLAEQADIAYGYACVIDSGKNATCWGESGDPPTIQWNDFSLTMDDMGMTIACGLRTSDNIVECWKTGMWMPMDPGTLGAVKQFDLGRSSACGIRVADDVVTCIGSGHSVDQLPSGLVATKVVVGTGAPNATCVIRTSDQNVQCWGGDSGQTNEPTGIVSEITAGQNYVAAVFVH